MHNAKRAGTPVPVPAGHALPVARHGPGPVAGGRARRHAVALAGRCGRRVEMVCALDTWEAEDVESGDPSMVETVAGQPGLELDDDLAF